MAKLVPAKCPSCGATVVVDPDLDACTCEYCGNAFIVSKAITNYTTNITNNVTNVYNKKVDNEYSAKITKSKSDAMETLVISILLIAILIAALMMGVILL